MSHSSIDPAHFKSTLGRFASGITVITTRGADGRDHGMTLSAFSSLSLDPPLVLVCIGDAASIAGTMATAEFFAVNVLAEDQEPLSRRFSAKDEDRFESIAMSRGANGLPLLDGALAHVQCRVTARYPGGDHTIIVGEVIETASREGDPLLYYRGGYARLDR
jgi:3-hydroxy-9,10-secoandrosta-1,3,5(10)-triene-9,17-dione monooxygenase reductase component